MTSYPICETWSFNLFALDSEIGDGQALYDPINPFGLTSNDQVNFARDEDGLAAIINEALTGLVSAGGVGAKVALAIMSVLSGDELTDAVIAEDKAAVSRANGVGPKLAARIVIELRDKVGAMAIGGAAKLAASLPLGAEGTADQEAVSVLVNLGFSRMQAVGVVARATHELGSDAVLDDLIKSGLKELGQ